MMIERLLVAALLAGPTFSLADDEPVRAQMGEDGVQRIEIVGGSYYFEPAHVIVQLGEPVELTLRKERGLAPHDFELSAPEADIDVHVELETDPQLATFTPQATGRFEFACTKDFPLLRSHYDRGMHGVLEIVD